MSSKPALFIGSSSEGFDVAEAAEVVLQECAEVTLWKDGVFGLNQNYLDALVVAAEMFDFAILVLTPDDVTESRGEARNSPRDNVLFEAGLFMGRLGKERTFLLYKEGDLKLPSDLAGISHSKFGERTDGNLRAAVRSACYSIRDSINRLGRVGSEPSIVDPISDTLKLLISNVHEALKFEHPDFHDEVVSNCLDWGETSSDWAEGRIVVRQHYERLLSNVYGSAQKSIFSTSIPDYQQTWLSPMGRALLRVQAKNKQAKSSRVFIFDERSDVTEDDKHIFEEHEDAGVEVLIYFDSEDAQFSFPPAIGKDWTIIDGGVAIAITKQIGDVYEAQYHFNNKGKAEQFLNFEQRLRRGSITSEEWRLDSRSR